MSASDTPLDADLALIASLVGTHADFPLAGITFKDIFPVLRHPKAHRLLLTRLTSTIQTRYTDIHTICGLDARGFLFGPTMACHLDASFVPIRKKGKLPGACEQVVYTTEYSSAESEIQKDAIQAGARVVLVDDLLATGGTLASAIQLIRALGGVVVACVVVMEIAECKGRERLVKECGLKTEDIHTLLTY